MRRFLLLSLLVACKAKGGDVSDARDTGPDLVPFEGCDPETAPSLVIGQGAGSAFFVLEESAAVGLDVAPQGGFGVSVRASTSGLMADNVVDVLLEVEHDGENVGSFINEGTNLYCQDDGTGLLWGVVVGFDGDLYPSNDDLLSFDGERVVLVVAATDVEGDTAVGRVLVNRSRRRR